MTARVWWRGQGLLEEVTDHFRTDSWSVSESAEEGSVGNCTMVADDADGTLGALMFGLTHIEITDDAIPGDIVVWAGHVGSLTVSRGDTVTERQLSLSLIDRNVGFGRRVLSGTASKRPAETDVERMQWLLGASEASSDFDDWTTYVSTASPVAMDACDYRGQSADQVASDCAAASGRNWWSQEMGPGPITATLGTGILTTAWYDWDTSTAYTGTAGLTNDPTLIDLAEWWPVGQDATLTRDYSRVYSGLYMPFDGGAVYRQRAATSSAYGMRDTTAPSLNVKSAAKAAARADRILSTMGAPHLRVSVSARLPPSAVNQFRAGMRVRASLTHLTDGLDVPWWYRILSRTVSQAAAGSLYDVALEMTPLEVYVAPADLFAALLKSGSPGAGTVPFVGTGDLPPAGWGMVPKLGPVSYRESASPYSGLVIGAASVVGVMAQVTQAGVGAVTLTLSILVNSAVVASQTVVTGSGYWNITWHAEAHAIPVAAGDVVTAQFTAGCGSIGIGNEFLAVWRNAPYTLAGVSLAGD